MKHARGRVMREPQRMDGTLSVDNIVGRIADVGDPIRLRTLRVLEANELSVGEIARVLQIPQSTASRHLRILANGGWVTTRSAGTASFYRMTPDDLSPAARDIWTSLRSAVGLAAEAQEDDLRVSDVLAGRAGDSMSFFGRVVGEWDAIRKELFGDTFMLHGLLALMPSDWTVADLGCGTGNVTSVLAPHVERVIAIDQSEPMLEAARRRLATERPEIDAVAFVEASIESMPLDACSVDAAVLSLVLHHAEDPSAVLRETARVLRRDRGGGVALVIEMEAHGRRQYRREMGHKHLGFGRDVLAEMFSAAGFESPSVRHIPSQRGSKGPGLLAAVARVREAP